MAKTEMTRSDLADTIDSTSEIVGRSVGLLARNLLWLLFWPVGRIAAEADNLPVTLARLRRLFQEAVGGGADEELIAALSALARRGDEIVRAFVVWVDLVETLVQDAERRYGTKPGQGQLKAGEVKAVFRYLLRAERFDIPQVPRILRTPHS